MDIDSSLSSMELTAASYPAVAQQGCKVHTVFNAGTEQLGGLHKVRGYFCPYPMLSPRLHNGTTGICASKIVGTSSRKPRQGETPYKAFKPERGNRIQHRPVLPDLPLTGPELPLPALPLSLKTSDLVLPGRNLPDPLSIAQRQPTYLRPQTCLTFHWHNSCCAGRR